MRIAFFTPAVLAAAVFAAGCGHGLPAYNAPFSEKILVVAPSPEAYSVRVEGADQPELPVPADGRLVIAFPVLPRECSLYVLGVKVRDRGVETRKLIHILRGGEVVERLSVRELRRRRRDAAGFYRVRLR